MVVDSHIHFWDTKKLEYPWLAEEPAINRSFLKSDLKLGASNVTSAVFVQADCLPNQGLAEAKWIANDSNDPKSPAITGIVAFAPLESPHALAYLEEVFAIPRVVGVRRLLQNEPIQFVENPTFHNSLVSVARARRSFDACVRAWQLPWIADIADKHPGLTVVIDHIGKPPVRDGISSEAGSAWNSAILELSLRSNVQVKLSGVAAESAAGSQLSSVSRPFLEAAIEYFGTDRCMVGSDWPVSARIPESRRYDQWFDIVQNTLGLSDAEWDQVSHRTAELAYGLPSDS